jgi:hypothetical protein
LFWYDDIKNKFLKIKKIILIFFQVKNNLKNYTLTKISNSQRIQDASQKRFEML